ncbi:L-ascorbate metabolism protein UlaG (beta-lactamase superfamily) [Neisseria sp. HSC-16F19]|nr:MBL fold metallo-hydrolase [Neisseria sp. HSC-16F19]MCP2040783.1 L-ascorbate metabolism protein UlaG (beta-lactamase superfamily) [Neisseria sp. HSC-16F19]
MNIAKTLLFALTLGMAAGAHAFDYQHIRNATAKISYGGATFLVDPYLAPKGSYAGFAGTVNSRQRNPLIDMQPKPDEVLRGVDAVIVTHTHDDHWDEAAQKALPKNIPVFVQNAGDAQTIRAQGFSDVRVLGKQTEFKGVKLSKTGGQHGTDAMYSMPLLAEMLGDAMGVVFQADNEKTLYIVGDTVWNEAVDAALLRYRPDVLVLNTGDAKLDGVPGGIIMGTADVAKAYTRLPQAHIITVHMDAVNHATVSSRDMRAFVRQNRFGDRVAVPREGQVLKY